jgi:hypothetical protein
MERNRLENLFKDKLEGHVLEPSIEARDRFQGMIQRKRRIVMIKRIGIAASIFLFTFAGIYSFRTYNTDKVDLAEGEFFDTAYGTEMAIVNVAPEPGSIFSGEEEKAVPESEMADNIKSLSGEGSSTENSKSGNIENHASMVQAGENDRIKSETVPQDLLADDQEYEQLTEEEVEESSYIEYLVADPDIMVDEQSRDISTEDQVREPMKITIEYIASGNRDTQSESKRSNFYSKLDKMKTMDEVLGDIRTYKDRLFALDFKKEEKVKKEEKSKE